MQCMCGLWAQNFQRICENVLELCAHAFAVVSVVSNRWSLVDFGWIFSIMFPRENCGVHEIYSTIYAAILPAMLMCVCCQEPGKDNHQVHLMLHQHASISLYLPHNVVCRCIALVHGVGQNGMHFAGFIL